MNTRRFPRSLSDAWPTEADRTGIHHDDSARARSVYSDADESAPRAWPFVWILISITLLLAALVAFGPSAQQEAEDVAASVDDAIAAAQMQAAIDRNCAGLMGRTEMQCALDTLQELQPERWIPEDAARAALAAPFATTDTKE